MGGWNSHEFHGQILIVWKLWLNVFNRVTNCVSDGRKVPDSCVRLGVVGFQSADNLDCCTPQINVAHFPLHFQTHCQSLPSLQNAICARNNKQPDKSGKFSGVAVRHFWTYSPAHINCNAPKKHVLRGVVGQLPNFQEQWRQQSSTRSLCWTAQPKKYRKQSFVQHQKPSQMNFHKATNFFLFRRPNCRLLFSQRNSFPLSCSRQNHFLK